MSTVIRLSRKGKRNQPYYHVVVADQDHPRDGKHTETIGHFNPRLEEKGFVMNAERYAHWLAKGAKPSDTIRTLVKKTASK
jgi:small subunit ribosomal protein S16